jgi:aspartokinase-like uncharacterized kinase
MTRGTKGSLLVVKVGGSLLGWEGFPEALERQLSSLRDERIVVIVGGGRFVDFLRELDSLHRIGEKRSHRLALRALDVTARLTADLVPGLSVVTRTDGLAQVWARGRVPVLAPRGFVRGLDADSPEPLPERWDVTSDSIAARLAVVLHAHELRLLKSTAPDGITTRGEASRSGLVDPLFAAVSGPCPRVTVVNLREPSPVVHELAPDRSGRDDASDARSPSAGPL